MKPWPPRRSIASGVRCSELGGGDGVPERAARKSGQTRPSRGSYLQVSNRAVTDGSAKSRREGIRLPKHAVLACLSRCLRTVLGRLRGQVDKAQGDSKMRRQREMQGWPGTRFPEERAHMKFAGNCTPVWLLR